MGGRMCIAGCYHIPESKRWFLFLYLYGFRLQDMRIPHPISQPLGPGLQADEVGALAHVEGVFALGVDVRFGGNAYFSNKERLKNGLRLGKFGEG